MTGHFTNNFARWSLFIIYVWFGALKVVDASPANPLVGALLERTLPFIGFDQFLVGLGIFEMIIGVLFLLPKYQRLLLVLFGIHMVMTTSALVMLPAVAWQGWFVPTLEGQYMIKNLIIIALALYVFADRPSKDTSSPS